MQGKRLVGLLIVLAVIIGVGAYMLVTTGSLSGGGSLSSAYEPLHIRGYVGGEKMNFIQNPEVTAILQRRYNLTVDPIKAGSIEMVSGDVDDVDFLWPGSSVALEIYESRGLPKSRDELIFNSPIVIYSWDIVADALEKQGIVQRVDDSYYVVDMPRLVQQVTENRTWSELGVPELYGTVTITSTDPTKSNSGNQFAALLAATLNDGQVVDATTVEEQIPTLRTFYAQLGFLHSSSGDLFSQFLKQGVGAYPLVVGYESQIVEFSLEHEDQLPLIKERIRILYPQPTVWSSHPLIALNEGGDRLIEALLDPEIQQIAWSQHGFRTGLTGVADDPSVLSVAGIPETISMVIPMPKAAVMDRIIEALSE